MNLKARGPMEQSVPSTCAFFFTSSESWCVLHVCCSARRYKTAAGLLVHLVLGAEQLSQGCQPSMTLFDCIRTAFVLAGQHSCLQDCTSVLAGLHYCLEQFQRMCFALHSQHPSILAGPLSCNSSSVCLSCLSVIRLPAYMPGRHCFWVM